MSISAMSSALAGYQANQNRFDAAAQQLAGAGLDGVDGTASGGDLVEGIVDSKTAEVGVTVNLAMLRKAMDMDKYVIDMLA